MSSLANRSTAVSRCLAAFLGLLMLCSQGCNLGEGHASAALGPDATFEGGRPLRIVATTGPVGDLVKHVVGDLGTVDVMMGPGVDPHVYKELPSDIKKLNAADIVFYNGLHLEGRMTDVLDRRGKKRPTFAVSQPLIDAKDSRIRFPEEFEGFADPHIWHDAALWANCLTAVVDRLSKFDPSNAEAYQAAGEAYRAELEALDKHCREQIESLPADRRVLVTAHDAFGYFSRAYGLEPVGLKGISTEDAVSSGRMDEVAKLIVDRKLPAIFAESSVTDRLVTAVIEPCKRAGHDVVVGGELYADALGKVGSGADTYIGMMRANVDTIVKGLRGEAAGK